MCVVGTPAEEGSMWSLRRTAGPMWINAVSSLALPVVPPPTGWVLAHCLYPSGAPATLMGLCLLPPHVLSMRPHSFAWQEAVSFLLVDGAIFIRSLILLLVLLSMGWFASEHTRSSPLSPSFYSTDEKLGSSKRIV